MGFPIDFSQYKPLTFSLSEELHEDDRIQLEKNISIVRDAVVFMTAYSNAKGFGGHTGGSYDIVPEMLIADAFVQGDVDKVYPVLFDEAGHRVAIQYVISALRGHMRLEALLKYREYEGNLPGHPERGLTPGIEFSSGRLGHIWPYVNGIALANPEKKILLFGSDGSQQEGNDAEAARFAVAKGLEVKLIIDDNDVTISGSPSKYMPGYNIDETLDGHGIMTFTGDGEDISSLYTRMNSAISISGPAAAINKRKMAPGIEGLEGTTKGHDVISVELAVKYLEQKGQHAAVDMLKSTKKDTKKTTYLGSSAEKTANRDVFGKALCEAISGMSPEERMQSVRVIDSDLEGSCGLHHVHKAYPDIFIPSGIMERHNYSLAAGFGSEKGRQGVFSTFSAFLEMLASEITMARLNHANVLAHFSHAGVDDIADNTCHYGINNFFADNGLPQGDTTRLYFPADANQMKAIVKEVFNDPGLRFVFSTRSSTPYILSENGEQFFAPERYTFQKGKDEIIREGKDGYIVSYGEMLYRCLHAAERSKKDGVDVGLINKPCLSTVDEDMMKKLGESHFVLLVESQNVKTGLGSRLGTLLLERGYHPKYAHMGANRQGDGGVEEQITHQHLDTSDIEDEILKIYYMNAKSW